MQTLWAKVSPRHTQALHGAAAYIGDVLSDEKGGDLLGDVVDAVQAQAGGGLHQSMRVDHHVH